MDPGKLISIYGANNTGKSSLVKALEFILVSEEVGHVVLKYPLYLLPGAGPMINDTLRKKNPHKIGAGELQALYTINRTKFQPAIKLFLEAGFLIIAEDYNGTGLAWGIASGAGRSYLEGMESDMIKPDLSFLVTGKRFMSGKEKSHIHEGNDDLMAGAAETHLKLAEEFHWIKIVNDKPPDGLAKDVWQIINEKFNINQRKEARNEKDL
jgi:thymidylate kinase